MTASKRFLGALAALFFLGLAHTASAAPKPDLWERWASHDPASTQSIDHQAWQQTLERFVVPADDGVNRFAYDQVDSAARQRLQDYLEAMSAIEISRYNRDQ